jgi:hypothetical protein
MQPKPIAETSRPLVPRVRVSMQVLLLMTGQIAGCQPLKSLRVGVREDLLFRVLTGPGSPVARVLASWLWSCSVMSGTF